MTCRFANDGIGASIVEWEVGAGRGSNISSEQHSAGLGGPEPKALSKAIRLCGPVTLFPMSVHRGLLAHLVAVWAFCFPLFSQLTVDPSGAREARLKYRHTVERSHIRER